MKGTQVRIAYTYERPWPPGASGALTVLEMGLSETCVLSIQGEERVWVKRLNMTERIVLFETAARDLHPVRLRFRDESQSSISWAVPERPPALPIHCLVALVHPPESADVIPS